MIKHISHCSHTECSNSNRYPFQLFWYYRCKQYYIYRVSLVFILSFFYLLGYVCRCNILQRADLGYGHHLVFDRPRVRQDVIKCNMWLHKFSYCRLCDSIYGLLPTLLHWRTARAQRVVVFPVCSKTLKVTGGCWNIKIIYSN